MMDVAIVGAGIAGLACGRKLSDAGVRVTIFDKGRGLGGRVATRRIDTLQFDHGAQHVTAKAEGFASILSQLTDAGVLAAWPEPRAAARLVAVPGMSALAKALAAGLDIRLSTQINTVTPMEGGWRVQGDALDHHASHLIMTVPAPQAQALLGARNPLAVPLGGIRFAPCLTLLAVTAGSADFSARSTPEEPLAWIARDNSKPGRPQTGASMWIAQAGEAFSQQHLDKDLDAIAREMLPLFCDAIGASAAEVSYAAGHRWRYAHAAHPLGEAFLMSPDRRLYAGGDWCLGTTIESAWQSGTAIAEDVLARA